MGQVESENRFSDCVFMKLHSVPISTEAKSSILLLKSITDWKTGSCNQIELRLTIRFGEQEIKVVGGHVWFGIKRGELKLKLENGKMPLESLALTPVFETVIELEVQNEESSETEGSTSVSVTGGVSARTKGSRKTATKAKYRDYQVTSRGSEIDPVWIFEAKTTPTLSGKLDKELLGVLQLTEKPARVVSVFEIRGQMDLHLTQAGGLWTKDISRNKSALLEREIFLRTIAPKLQPYLSRMEFECE